MTAPRFVNCRCGHTHAMHPERLDEACIAEGCECEEYIPGTRPVAPATVGARPPAQRGPDALSLHRAMPPQSVEQLLAAGKRSSAKRTLAVVEKVEGLLEDLRQRLLAEHQAADEQRKAAAEREAAREEIVRLEAQLEQARAKLKTPKPTSASRAHPPTYGEFPCTAPGCDKVSTTAQGLAAHRRSHAESVA